MMAVPSPQITHPDDLKAQRDRTKKLMTGTIREYSTEKRYVRKNGSIIWVKLTVSPMWEIDE